LFFKGLLAPILADFFRRVKRKNFLSTDTFFSHLGLAIPLGLPYIGKVRNDKETRNG
jgi:hypothetical protein